MVENIYETPESNLELKTPVEISTFGKVLCTLMSLATVIIYRGLHKIMIPFSDTFNSFGADLPLLTRLIIKISGVFPYFSMLCFAPMLIWLGFLWGKKFERIIYKVGGRNFQISLVVFIISMFSLYLPIFQLGEV